MTFSFFLNKGPCVFPKLLLMAMANQNKGDQIINSKKRFICDKNVDNIIVQCLRNKQSD